MPFEQTITVINNSGKIISTGKHLVNIFKDAKAAYQEKKDSIRARKGGLSRAQTFDVVYEEWEEPPSEYRSQHGHGHGHRFLESRRRSHDDLDGRSHASSRSHRSRRSRSSRHDGGHKSKARPPLTESNLRTLSEVSSTAPSEIPRAYRSPYAETAPRDMALSRPTLHAYQTAPPASPSTMVPTNNSTPISTPRHSLAVARPRSDPSLRQRAKTIDMNLAYGSIPPDLESRTDLDPVLKEESRETEARTLMQRIEGLLTEAECLHHTASAIISHLQVNPEAAAAVALTLAELSALLAKMSPGFLAVVKGGSPAIFALLASPQFLIGTGIAVGVTVVMFGGWKIVQRIREAKAAKEAGKMGFEMQEQPVPQPGDGVGGAGFAAGARFGGGGGSGSFDEALVLDEELSTIETWRRGIVPFGEEGSVVDVELISPEAMRSRRGEDARSVKTHKTGKSHKSHKSSRSHRSSRHGGGDDGPDDIIPERKSSKGFGKEAPRSEAGSQRTSRSKRTDKVEVKAIEDGSRRGDESLDVVLRPKGNMLKQLFKKKKDRDGLTSVATESVMA